MTSTSMLLYCVSTHNFQKKCFPLLHQYFEIFCDITAGRAGILGSSTHWEEVKGKIYRTHEMISRCLAEKRQVDVLAVASGCCQGWEQDILLTKTHASWSAWQAYHSFLWTYIKNHFQIVQPGKVWALSDAELCSFITNISPAISPPAGIVPFVTVSAEGYRQEGECLITTLLFPSLVCLTSYLWQICTYAAICKQQHCLSQENVQYVSVNRINFCSHVFQSVY